MFGLWCGWDVHVGSVWRCDVDASHGSGGASYVVLVTATYLCGLGCELVIKCWSRDVDTGDSLVLADGHDDWQSLHSHMAGEAAQSNSLEMHLVVYPEV